MQFHTVVNSWIHCCRDGQGDLEAQTMTAVKMILTGAGIKV